MPSYYVIGSMKRRQNLEKKITLDFTFEKYRPTARINKTVTKNRKQITNVSVGSLKYLISTSCVYIQPQFICATSLYIPTVS